MVISAAANLIAHIRDLHKLAVGGLQDWGVRIASWLVLGIATALVIGFNAIIGGAPCDRIRLAEVLWSFAIGLGGAFAGVIVSLGAGIMSTHLLGNITTLMGRVEMDEINLQRIEDRFGPQPDDSILNKSIEEHLGKLPELQKRLSRILMIVGVSVVFYLASAIFFARGTLLPVVDGILLQSCAR